MNLSRLLEHNARKYSLNEAVVGMGQRLTYKALNDLVDKLSTGLLKAGIKKDDKIILFMPNVPEFIITYFAAHRIEAIIVPINAKSTFAEIEYIFNHADAKAFVVHELLFDSVKDLQNECLLVKTGGEHQGWVTFNELTKKKMKTLPKSSSTDDEPSTILYTSGTTGQPKGVLFSHRNVLTVAKMICIEMEMKPESRLLLMMPLSHSAPLHLFMVAGVIVGATLVLTPTFTPDLLLKTVEEERTTHFFGAPVAYLMTGKNPAIDQTDLSTMKWWIYGGAPLSSGEVLFVKQAFKTNNLVCVYGLTEAGPSGTLLLGHEHDHKAGSIGKRAALFTEIRVVNANGEDVGVAEVGEIYLRGDGTMLGYYKNPEATAATFDSDWLKTGDLARVDEDGYIFIVDRKKDMIISGGVNIYPKEVEDALITYEAVSEVAIVGVPHAEWGETVKAYFAANRPVESKELIEHLNGKVSSFKIPKLFEQVQALPRNASGKILKQSLREVGK
ncbi:class I adenylate-forming enzyme family protein [Psychrobacillus sp. NPDC096623]|uniref:class I adenylate-forming enzyme family protein n=1 Tax=Psychrobacillus sp. NPDC096623 TaxID=3364492 RepID=UPI00380F7B4C